MIRLLTGVIVSLVAVLLLVFLLVYKKEMIIKMFMLNISAPANEFTQQLEQSADSIIRRLENEAAELELLLEEAESKIGMLSQQVEHANKIIEQLMELENNQKRLDQKLVSLIETENPPPLPTALSEVEATHSIDVDNMEDIVDLSQINNKELANLEKHRLIIAMADQGYNVTEIAKATGMGKGEIILLLQLNKK